VIEKSKNSKSESYSHIKEVCKMFSCDHCDKKFRSTQDLSRHETVHTKLRAFKCTLCSKAFAQKVNLNRHVRIEHDKQTPFNSFKCDHCDKVFDSNSDLSRHQLVHNKLRDFKCTLCSKIFGQKSNLIRHIATIHEKQTPFKCEKCDKVFASNSDLSRHQTVHTKLRSFVCTLCIKTFAQEVHLHTHVRSVHEKLKPFRCDHCDKVFAYKFGLKRHSLRFHGYKYKFEVSQVQKKCLSCYQILKTEVARHLCDKCYVKLHPIIILKMAQIPEEETEEKIIKIPKLHLNHNVIKTFRCLECCFSTEDDFAMLKHHLNNHIITTDIV
jgi:KRAB domain-containing zinc finger protein